MPVLYVLIGKAVEDTFDLIRGVAAGYDSHLESAGLAEGFLDSSAVLERPPNSLADSHHSE